MKHRVVLGSIFFLLLSTNLVFCEKNPVFIKIKVEETSPTNVPVQIAITTLAKVHITLTKFGITRDGQTIPFDTAHGSILNWDNIPAIVKKGGEETPWIDISQQMSQEPKSVYDGRKNLKTLVILFNTPNIPLKFPKWDKKNEQGNLDGISITIKFATGPSDREIVKSISYKTERSLVPLVIYDADKDLAVYGPKIKTFYEYTTDRLEILRSAGLEKDKLPKEIITATTIIDGPYYSLYDRATILKEAEILRLMGIRFINGWRNVNRDTFSEQSPFFIGLGGGGPMAMGIMRNLSNWNDYREKAINYLKNSAEEWMKNVGFKKGEQLFVKEGDEPSILQKDDILRTSNGVDCFRTWLKKKGISPEFFGYVDFSKIEPLFDWQKAQENESNARLYYWTVCFQQDFTAWMWNEYKGAVRRVYGKGALVGTCAFYGGFDSTPDYFLFSKSGVWDIHMHHYLTDLRAPIYHMLFLGDMLKSSSKFGKSINGGLWALDRIGPARGAELTGMSGLIRGMRFFYLYDYGPAATQWGFVSDDIEKCLAVSKIFRYASKIEDFIVNGRTQEPQVALLNSRGSEIWLQPPVHNSSILSKCPMGLITEKQMLITSLELHQIPVEILPDEEIPLQLDRYKVLYITDPHISEEAQEKIKKWVNDGGVLFMIAGAGVKNEYNQQSSIISKFTNGKGEIVETNQNIPQKYSATNGLYGLKTLDTAQWDNISQKPITFEVVARKEKLNIPHSKILANYQDGTPAAVSINYGNGTVIKIGTFIGTSLARTAVPSFKEGRLENITERTLNEGITEIYLYPVKLAKIDRPIVISVFGIDATFYENKDRAVLLFADYTTGKPRNIDVEVCLKKTYKKCRTFTGSFLPIEYKNGKLFIRNIVIENTQLLFLE